MTNLKELNNKVDDDKTQTLESMNDTAVINVMMDDKDKKDSPKFELTLLSKGIEFYLINDLSLKYYPIIHLTFNNFKVLLMNNVLDEMNIKFTSSLKANYFNAKISLWEPFIEKFNICLSYTIIQKEENPNQNIVLVFSDLNINLSEEFVFKIMIL